MTDPFDQPEAGAADDSTKIKRDRYGRYVLPEWKGDNGLNPVSWAKATGTKEVPWTRATTFAKSISDTYALSQWSQRMAVKGVMLRDDLQARAYTLDVQQDKEEFNALVESAKEAANAKGAANLGTAMHTFTEQLDTGVLSSPEEAPPRYQADLQAYAKLLEAHGIEIESVEQRVIVPRFQVAGTYDRIGRHAGRHKIVDLKTGRDLQYGWNEIAIQLCLYAGAAARWDADAQRYVPLPPNLDQDTALVIHLPVGKGEATLYEVDLILARQAAALCHQVRNWRKAKGLAKPVSVVEVEPEEAQISTASSRRKDATVRAVSWEERLELAKTSADLTQIWKEATAVGAWTTELALAGQLRHTQIKADARRA